jgi:hypothetical protein
MTRPSEGIGQKIPLAKTICLIWLATLLFSFPGPRSFFSSGVKRAYAQAAATTSGKSAKGKISYTGGPGDTLKTAVVIHGALNSLDGITAENNYLKKKFGQENWDWQFVRKSTLQNGDEYFDKVEIEFRNLRKKTIFFNITEFFGKL